MTGTDKAIRWSTAAAVIGVGSSGRSHAAAQRWALAGLGSSPWNTSARKSSIICLRWAVGISPSLFV